MSGTARNAQTSIETESLRETAMTLLAHVTHYEVPNLIGLYALGVGTGMAIGYVVWGWWLQQNR